MAKLNSDWFYAFDGSFQEEEDVINFIFERLDTSNFQDSYIDYTVYGESNEMCKVTKEDKKEMLYNFMMELIERRIKK